MLYISDRLNQNEDMASASKKYKAQIEKLINEKKTYEERANAMCAEMGEQMTLLQVRLCDNKSIIPTSSIFFMCLNFRALQWNVSRL